MQYKLTLNYNQHKVLNEAILTYLDFLSSDLDTLLKRIAIKQYRDFIDVYENLNGIVRKIAEKYTDQDVSYQDIQASQTCKKAQGILNKVFSQSEEVRKKVSNLNAILHFLDGKSLCEDKTLILSPDMLKQCLRPLDFYSRIHVGQVEELCYDIRFMLSQEIEEKETAEFEHCIYDFKKKLFPYFSLRQSRGIGGKDVSIDAQIAYELFKIIGYAISWQENPEGGMGVNYQRPLNFSGTEFATISIEE